MAIDSALKRKSIAAIPISSFGPVVVASGTIAQADRQVIAYSYAGILAAEPSVFVAQIYTANVLANISPIRNVLANISPIRNVFANISPTREVEIG